MESPSWRYNGVRLYFDSYSGHALLKSRLAHQLSTMTVSGGFPNSPKQVLDRFLNQATASSFHIPSS
jgi:hypothetical protein